MQATDDQKSKLDEFFSFNSYVQGSYDQTNDFQKLDEEIVRLTKTANRLFYFALPPSTYQSVATHLKENCMATGLFSAECLCFHLAN